MVAPVVVIGQHPTGHCAGRDHKRCPVQIVNKGGREMWMCPCKCHREK